jgi:FkbM family methyltransferase
MSFISLVSLRVKKVLKIILHPRMRSVFFRHRVMAGVEHKVVLLQDLATVVDIGANRGQFALAARAMSGANVISFEPLPAVAKIFRTVFADDSAVKLHVAAIGDKYEKKRIHLSARDDSSSLLEIGEGQSEYFPGTQEVGSLEVQVGCLDQYVGKQEIIRPALLKLDVQGFEIQALQGCKTLLGNFDYVYCECSFVELYKDQKLAGDVIEFLRVAGFNLTGIYNPFYDRHGNCIQADLSFGRV